MNKMIDNEEWPMFITWTRLSINDNWIGMDKKIWTTSQEHFFFQSSIKMAVIVALFDNTFW